MKVQASYYAMLREIAGIDHDFYDLPDGSTVEALMAAVAARHPGIGERRKHLAVVSGSAYVNSGYRLSEGEDISLIPPVSGGRP